LKTGEKSLPSGSEAKGAAEGGVFASGNASVMPSEVRQSGEASSPTQGMEQETARASVAANQL